MHAKATIRSLTSAGLLCLLSLSGHAGEDAKAGTGEALWEISKEHLKDPFQWPSVWKSSPQADDPNGIEALKHQPSWSNGKEPAPPRADSVRAKPRLDWRASEERRTRVYLQKVGPLTQATYLPMPAEENRYQDKSVPGQSGRHFLAQPLLLSTPFLASSREGGRIFPNECKLKYSASNESDILQLYDEVTLNIGRESGVKSGDLYRTYQVGPVYRSFANTRKLGKLVETNGIVEVLRVGPKSSVARLVKCFGTMARDTRACPLRGFQEVSASGYVPLTDGKLSAQVVWVTEQQQLPQPYSYAVLDRGAKKGFKIGDMVLFYNRNSGKMTEKVLGNGLVVNAQEESATVLIQELLPGIINRGDYVVAIQTTLL